MNAEREILWGVFCVQLGFASPKSVLEHIAAWTVDRERGLGDRFLSNGLLDPEKKKLIDGMVEAAIQAQGGNAQEAMHTLGGDRIVYASLGGSLVKDDQGRVTLVPLADGMEGQVEDTDIVCPETPGRYHFEEGEVGRGGIGRVMVAFDKSLGRRIAVKELLKETGSPRSPSSDAVSVSRSAIARFLLESRVTGQLEHPNIVPVYELGRRADGTIYYTMKLVRGRTLSLALANCSSLADRLKLLHHFVDLCNAIAYAHSRGVVHRDIKTDNVMLGEFGETVVLDWGLSKVQGKQDTRRSEIAKDVQILQDAQAGKTLDGNAIGTPAYMSPEQADGQIDAIDERSDVWSLGVVLYEILTGHTPFEGYTPFEIMGKVLKQDVVPAKVRHPAIPAELSAVAQKALSRNKDDRYQKAGDLCAEIEAYMSGGRIKAYDYSSWELLKGFISKHKAITTLASLSLAIILISSIALYFAYRNAETEKRRAQRSEQISNLNFSAALQEKASRLFEERRILSSRIYSSASLVNHPCVHLGLTEAARCDAEFHGGDNLRMRAASNVYQSNLSVLVLPEWRWNSDIPFQRLSLSEDGHLLATKGSNSKVGVWDIRTRTLLFTLDTTSSSIRYGIAVSPNGERIAVAKGEENPSVELFDTAGKQVGVINPNLGKGLLIDFSVATGLLAICNGSGVFGFWDPTTGKQVGTIDTGSPLRSWGISKDGAFLVTCNSESCQMFEIANGKRLWKTDGIRAIRRVSFSPDGQKLAFASDLRNIEILDTKTGARLHSLVGHKEAVTSANFSPNGSMFVSGSTDRTLRFWDATSFELLDVIEDPRATFFDLQFFSDGNRMVTVGEDGSLQTWRIEFPPRLRILNTKAPRIWQLEFAPDSQHVAYGDGNGMLGIWDTRSQEPPIVLDRSQGECTSVSYSADGGRLAAQINHDSLLPGLTVWDVRSQKPLMRISEPGIFAVGLSMDGRMATSHTINGVTKLWDVETGKERYTVETDGCQQAYLSFSPDGQWLVTGGIDKTVRLWDVQTGKRIKTLTGHPDNPYNFSFSHDHQKLVSSGYTGRILLWDLTTDRVVREFNGHQRWVNSVAFLPDDSILVSASDDGTVRLWSVETGENLLIIRVGSEGMYATPSPDGTSIAVIDGSQIKLYPLDLSILKTDPQQLLDLAQREAGVKLDGFVLSPLDNPSPGEK